MWALRDGALIIIQGKRTQPARKTAPMPRNDMPLVAPGDIPAAFGLLTRLPVRVDTLRATARGAAAAWAWPLVGAVVGGCVWAVGAASHSAGLDPEAAGVLALATGIILTGAMHEDGLADCADGFWGGWDRARRLAIMKDSQIGTYGVIALILTLFLRWLALNTLLTGGAGPLSFIAIGALSRAPMAVLMAALPNARGAGLSASVGRPRGQTAALGVGLAVCLGVPGLGWGIFGAGLCVLVAGGAVALIARSKIGGQTGDVLGAVQQISEMVLLLLISTGAKGFQ